MLRPPSGGLRAPGSLRSRRLAPRRGGYHACAHPISMLRPPSGGLRAPGSLRSRRLAPRRGAYHACAHHMRCSSSRLAALASLGPSAWWLPRLRSSDADAPAAPWRPPSSRLATLASLGERDRQAEVHALDLRRVRSRLRHREEASPKGSADAAIGSQSAPQQRQLHDCDARAEPDCRVAPFGRSSQ